MGSEFRPVPELKILMGDHPLWRHWEEGLKKGASYPLSDYPDADMLLDLLDQIDRGNHQSADKCLPVLEAMDKVDVEHGYAFCLLVEAIQHIVGAAIAPHGMVHQGIIDEFGQYATKDRPTHDQSFLARKTGQSINDRCMHLLTPCVFGQHALLRIIHFILHLQRLFPRRRIFLQKMDFKSAYRRMHLSADMAAKCITVVRDLAYLSLRLPFGGGRPCPSLWSDFLEGIIDLSNVIANDPSGTPTSSTRHSST
jgi:hypothetical protein